MGFGVARVLQDYQISVLSGFQSCAYFVSTFIRLNISVVGLHNNK